MKTADQIHGDAAGAAREAYGKDAITILVIATPLDADRYHFAIRSSHPQYTESAIQASLNVIQGVNCENIKDAWS